VARLFIVAVLLMECGTVLIGSGSKDVGCQLPGYEFCQQLRRRSPASTDGVWHTLSQRQSTLESEKR